MDEFKMVEFRSVYSCLVTKKPSLKIYLNYLLFLASTLFSFDVWTHQNKQIYIGLALMSENTLGKITSSPSGSKSLMGSQDIPLMGRYDFEIQKGLFVSPRLAYGLLGRDSAGDAITATNLHIFAPIGRNLSNGPLDWGIGPGLLRRELKGRGGVVTLNNGTSTSQFALPGRTVETQTITLNFGASMKFYDIQAGFDLITEGAFSNSKRTFSVLLSVTAPLGTSRGGKR